MTAGYTIALMFMSVNGCESKKFGMVKFILGGNLTVISFPFLWSPEKHLTRSTNYEASHCAIFTSILLLFPS